MCFRSTGRQGCGSGIAACRKTASVLRLPAALFTESAVGGPLALVRTGDRITVDVPARRIHLEVSDTELATRRAAWTPPAARYERGYGWLFGRQISCRPMRDAILIFWRRALGGLCRSRIFFEACESIIFSNFPI